MPANYPSPTAEIDFVRYVVGDRFTAEIQYMPDNATAKDFTAYEVTMSIRTQKGAEVASIVATADSLGTTLTFVADGSEMPTEAGVYKYSIRWVADGDAQDVLTFIVGKFNVTD